MTSPLLTQVAVEVLRSPDPDPLLTQVAVEVLRTDPKPALLTQVAVEVLSINVPDVPILSRRRPLYLAC